VKSKPYKARKEPKKERKEVLFLVIGYPAGERLKGMG